MQFDYMLYINNTSTVLLLITILNLHATYAGDCLSGLVVQSVYPNGGVVNEFVGSTPSATIIK